MLDTLPAIIFTLFTAIVVIFQGGLALGMPWGAASMGGKFPGKYPPRMRVVAVINMLVLSLIAVVVLTRAGVIFPEHMPFATTAIWFVVAFSAVGIVLNTITPSKIERIWAPVAAVQFIMSLIVAVS